MSIKHRVLIVSDTHYGADWRDWAGPPPGDIVDYQERWDLFMARVIAEKDGAGLDHVILNGDLITASEFDNKAAVISALEYVRDQIIVTAGLPLAASYGNHEGVSEGEWQSIFGFPRSSYFEIGDYVFLCPRTSNEAGSRTTCFDEGKDLIRDKFREFSDKKGIIIAEHITPFADDDFSGQTQNCEEKRHYYPRSHNLVCALHGHFHASAGKYTFGNESVKHYLNGHFGNYGNPVNYGYQILEIMDDDSIYLGRYDAVDNDWDMPMTELVDWQKPWNDFPWGEVERRKLFIPAPVGPNL